MKKVALITGITGQDGSYLAEFLLKKIIKFLELKEDRLRLTQKELTTSTTNHIYKESLMFIIAIY